jgi:hypothetical protein
MDSFPASDPPSFWARETSPRNEDQERTDSEDHDNGTDNHNDNN